MDLAQLTNLISNIGFPAVVCILLLKNNQEQANVIRDNTKVMQSLVDKIDTIIYKGVNDNAKTYTG